MHSNRADRGGYRTERAGRSWWAALASGLRAAAVVLAACVAMAPARAAEPHNHALRQDAPPALSGAAVVLETRQGERVTAYAAGPLSP